MDFICAVLLDFHLKSDISLDRLCGFRYLEFSKIEIFSVGDSDPDKLRKL